MQREWSVDEIISLEGAEEVLELVLRLRHCDGGGYPSREYLDKMGDLANAVMMRLNGYKDAWNQSTAAEGTVSLAKVHVSQEKRVFDTFTSYIEGGTADAKRKGETHVEELRSMATQSATTQAQLEKTQQLLEVVQAQRASLQEENGQLKAELDDVYNRSLQPQGGR